MPMPSAWVEHLFAKLTVRYGAAFTRAYADLDPIIVKADWAEVLDGVSGSSMSYALRYLPAERPPNAMQFRDICRRAPATEVQQQIAGPQERADPGRVAQLMSELRSKLAAQSGMSPAEKCAANIMRIVAERGGRISPPQKAQLDAINRMLGRRQSFDVEPMRAAAAMPVVREEIS